MKKALSLILALLMLFAATAVFTLPGAADDYDFDLSGEFENENTGDSFTWTLTVEGVLTISGEGAMPDFAELTDRPWDAYASSIKKVIVEDGVTKTGKSSFSTFSSLKEIEFGSTVASIAMDTMAYCGSLTTIVFKGPISEIGQGSVWASENISSVTVTGQTRDEFLAVAAVRPYNDNYQNATFTEKELIVAPPSSGVCGDSLTWTLEDGVLTISGSGEMYDFDYYTVPWKDSRESITRLVVEEGVTSIGLYALKSCSALSEVHLPKSIESVGRAFGDCENLEIVYYAGTVADYDNIAVAVYSEEPDDDNLPFVSAFKWCEEEEHPEIYTWHFKDGEIATLNYDTMELTVEGLDAYLSDVFRICGMTDGLNPLAGKIVKLIVKEGSDNIEYSEPRYWSSLEEICIPVSFKGSIFSSSLWPSSLKKIYYQGSEDEFSANLTMYDPDPSVEIIYNYNPAGVTYGDVNGDGFVNKKDSLMLSKYLAGFDTSIDLAAADVFPDGNVNKKDSLRLKQYLAGWDVVLGA